MRRWVIAFLVAVVVIGVFQYAVFSWRFSDNKEVVGEMLALLEEGEKSYADTHKIDDQAFWDFNNSLNFEGFDEADVTSLLDTSQPFDIDNAQRVLSKYKPVLDDIEKRFKEKPGYSVFSYFDLYNGENKYVDFIAVLSFIQLMCLDARVMANAGNTEAAGEKLLTALETTEYLCSRPELISEMMRIACEAVIFKNAEKIIYTHKIKKDWMELFHIKLTRLFKKEKEIYKSIIDEHKITLTTYCYMMNVTEASGELVKGYLAFIFDARKPYDFIIDKNKQIEKYNPQNFYREKQDIKKFYKFCDLFAEHYNFLKHPILVITFPNFLGCFSAVVDNLAARRGMLTISAIKLFEAKNSRLPKTLDELKGLLDEKYMTDPFSGKKFIYKLKSKGYELYSVGENGIDDGCMGKDMFSGQADIPFHKP